MMKRFLMLTLLTLAVTIAAFTALAESSGTCGDGLTWVLDNDGLLTISGSGYMRAGGWDKDLITKIVIEEGATDIPPSAFSDCANLTEVSIPDSVTSIDNYAFSGCASLKRIVIPDSVYTLGDYAFEYCSSLEQITLSNRINKLGIFAFRDCEALTSITIPGSVTTIDNCAFYRCTNLENVTLSNGIKSLGGYVFQGCSSLKEIFLPASVTSVAETYGTAFTNCENLQRIDVDVNNQTFSSVDGMLLDKEGTELIKCPEGKSGTVLIPSGVKTIYRKAFYFCKGLTAVTLPNSVKSLSEYSFQDCTNLSEITIPRNLTSIGYRAFISCPSLTDIYYTGTAETWDNIAINDQGYDTGFPTATIYYIPMPVGANLAWTLDENGLLTISGTGAMDDFTDDMTPWFDSRLSVAKIFIDEGVTSIGNWAFDNLENVTEISIPDSITRIGDYAFYDCEGLQHISLPEAVSHIGEDAFGACFGLMDITVDAGNSFYMSEEGVLFTKDQTEMLAYPMQSPIESYSMPDGVRVIRACAFADNTNLKEIILPSSVAEIEYSAFRECTSLESITLPDSIDAINNNTFWGCDSLKSVTIPGNVTRIGECAFSWCDSLTSVFMGDGVTEINYGAFQGCSALSEISLPKNLIYIDDYAFAECASLKKVVMQYGLTSIGACAFSDCSALTEIEIPASIQYLGSEAFSDCINLTEISVPVGITAIAPATFYNCEKLTAISIESGVSSIHEDAFVGCVSLTDVYYNGTRSLWENISIDAGNDCLETATFHYAPPSMMDSSSFGNGWRWRLYSDYTLKIDGSGDMMSFQDEAPTWEYYAYDIVIVTIPYGVNSIGAFAFGDCYNLMDVYFFGTSSEWAQIEIGEGNEPLLNANLHCIDNILYLPKGLSAIESQAFAELPDVDAVWIPFSVESIADDAFSGSDVIIITGSKSIMNWAESNGYIVSY